MCLPVPKFINVRKVKAHGIHLKPLSFFDKKLFKRLKKHASRLKVSSKKKIKKIPSSSKVNLSLIKKPRKKGNLNNSQTNHSVYQPTNIINTRKISFSKDNKRWHRFREFIKENTFLEPDPLLDWRVYSKILCSFFSNILQKGGSGLTIYSIYSGIMNFFDYRLKMVRYALEFGVSKASKEFKTTRKTVYKYLRRYREEGLEGLKNKPKKPKRIPHKIPKEYQDYILSLRDKHPSWGAKRLKLRYKLKYSHTAINRVLRQNGRIKKKKRKHIKKKELQEIKRKYRVFEYNQIDVKDLSDIPNYWVYMKRLNLPRYQYTFRELSTGTCFYAYSDENNSYYAGLFALYVIEHLKKYNISPKTMKIIFQTDNGSEFIGNVRKNIKKKSFFEKILENNHIEHQRIPTRSPTFNSDIEAFHKIIEDEFYECEDYQNKGEFFAKAYSYLLFFNYERENTNKDNKSPYQLLKEKEPYLNDKILNLPPIRLEWLAESMESSDYKSVYHVPLLPKIYKCVIAT